MDHRYWELLVKGRDDAMASFDKAIMTLAGGGLALGLGFVRAEVHHSTQWKATLVLSWVCFTVSLCCILVSFLSSKRSFDEALVQIHDPLDPERIYRELPGGAHAEATDRLNLGALLAFSWASHFWLSSSA